MRGLVPVSWEEALEAAEERLRAARGSVVVAFSGAETVEQADALSRLARQGLGSNTALLPDLPDPVLERYRAPLSAIRSAQVCLVVGDDPVVERAPIVDLWLRAARRAGAEVITIHPAGTYAVPPGSAAAVCAALAQEIPPEELRDIARKLQDAERVALVWSEDDPTGGRHVAALARALELGEESGVYWLPRTPNGVGVAQAWLAAGDGHGDDPPADGEIGALIVSGDEALADPRVLELAERADFVLTTSMFMSEVTGQSHLVLPGCGYLERDGTTVNLEGRPQRQRRAVEPPGWTELEFFARLAQRFGVDVSPWPTAGVAEHAPLPPRPAAEPGAELPLAAGEAGKPRVAPDGAFALVTYRPLFSGRAVERVPQLQFQRPVPEVELPYADARERGVKTGDSVVVSSNGTARELRARLNRRLRRGVVRIAAPHAAGLDTFVRIERVEA
jgi:NADH-quinone oxidoreductase subunit G